MGCYSFHGFLRFFTFFMFVMVFMVLWVYHLISFYYGFSKYPFLDFVILRYVRISLEKLDYVYYLWLKGVYHVISS